MYFLIQTTSDGIMGNFWYLFLIIKKRGRRSPETTL